MSSYRCYTTTEAINPLVITVFVNALSSSLEVMAALAALVNKAVPDDKSIILFYNTGNAQLGLAFQSGTSTDDQPKDIWEPRDDDYNGYILNPSSISAAYYRGLNYVAAVTMPKLEEGATQTVNQISLVSPIYLKLTTTTLNNTNVALCVTPDGNDGWLYHIRYVMLNRDFLVKLDYLECLHLL